jgi:hypothetical protein
MELPKGLSRRSRLLVVSLERCSLRETEEIRSTVLLVSQRLPSHRPCVIAQMKNSILYKISMMIIDSIELPTKEDNFNGLRNIRSLRELSIWK